MYAFEKIPCVFLISLKQCSYLFMLHVTLVVLGQIAEASYLPMLQHYSVIFINNLDDRVEGMLIKKCREEL